MKIELPYVPAGYVLGLAKGHASLPAFYGSLWR